MARPESLAGACAAAALALALAAPGARADEFNYDLSTGIGHSDNIERTHSDQESETIWALGAKFDYVHDGARFDAQLNGDVDWYDYLQNTYSADLVGNAMGNVVYAIVPERFTWSFSDNFGQAQTNPFQPVTPDNRENVNVFSTGPDFILGIGSRNQARLFGRWSDMYYQKSSYDGQRWLGGLSFERSLSSQSKIALNGTYAQMDYDSQPSSSDFNVQEYYASYETSGARTTALVNLGYRSLDRDGQTSSGPLAKLVVTRSLSEASTLDLRAGSQYGDTGSFLKDYQDNLPPGGGEGPIVASNDVAQRDYVEGAWRFRRPRTDFYFGAGYNDLDYEEQDSLDESWWSLRAHASRKLRQTLTLGGGVTWRDYNFKNVSGQDYNQLGLSANLSWKPVRAFYTDIEVQYFDRSADQPDGGYNETRVWLWVGYAPGAD